MKRRLFLAAAAASLCASTVLAGTRFHEYTAKYKDPPNPATPVACGYIGGSGDEYLAGGAFLRDGSVLLAGTCVGPKFDPPGVKVRVLGSDGTAPASPVAMTKDGRGRERLSTPQWDFLDGAGFIVHLAPGYRTIKNAVRFPWGSGTLTDVVSDGKGSIYVTGTVGPNFSKLTRASKLDTGLEGSGTIFLGKMKADLSGFEWCHLIAEDLWSAPKLRLLKNGYLSLIASDAFHFDTSGKLLKATKLQRTNSWSRGVDPVTHATATGGDGNTNTGYEPWRKPVLYIFNDKGEHTDEFYRWNEKIVGMNGLRLVSDSDVRVLSYDNDGKLIVVGWSDGGNSVFEYCPYDIRRSVYEAAGTKGLGFSLWGARVGSFCHIMKIDPESGEPLGKTIFVAYLAGKQEPSGLGLDTVDSAVDDSLLMAGGSAYGLIQTGNNVNNFVVGTDYIGGPFVGILTPKMDSIRFSSCMPNGGAVNLARHNKDTYAKWGIRSGYAGSKPMALFVCGAKESDKLKPISCPQSRFGGGMLDGQYVILGL